MGFMYCPECRAEYQPGVLTCADCGVPLVRELPARGPRDVEGTAAGGEHAHRARGEGAATGGDDARDQADDARFADDPDAGLEYVDLVCVFDGFDLGRCMVARSLLESAGLEVFPPDYLQPFHGVSMSPGVLGGGQGAYRLWVQPDVAEEARAVLAEVAASGDQALGSPDDEAGESEDSDDETDDPK